MWATDTKLKGTVYIQRNNLHWNIIDTLYEDDLESVLYLG